MKISLFMLEFHSIFDGGNKPELYTEFFYTNTIRQLAPSQKESWLSPCSEKAKQEVKIWGATRSNTLGLIGVQGWAYRLLLGISPASVTNSLFSLVSGSLFSLNRCPGPFRKVGCTVQ